MKAQEIEEALGIRLIDREHDLELIEDEWRAFFRNPLAYVGTVVIDMVNLWYSEVHPQPGFADAYSLGADRKEENENDEERSI